MDLEAPACADDVFEDRDIVPASRPLMQGDIFSAVSIPGLETQPPAVMIVQHPCSMRSGATLRPRLTVCAVRKQPTITEKAWQGFAWAMLLPEMSDGQDFAADFRDVGSVASGDLRRPSRIASLSNYGIYVLQQRNVYYQTRLTLDVATLAESFEALAAELELQQDWVEAAVPASAEAVQDDEVMQQIADAEAEFGSYLDANDRALRKSLQSAVTRADVRRQVRVEIAKSFQH